MDPAIYRAYSIRGIAGESLTAADTALIGRASGTLLRRQGLHDAVLGRDYRASSKELAAALVRGLVAAGIDVIDIGACPTPLLNFATDHYRAGAGLMVTASHNPPRYNGYKIRTDHTLAGEELAQIRELVEGGDFAAGSGRLSRADPVQSYVAALCDRAAMTRPLRLVVDAGSGAAGPLVPALLERLGCQAVPLYCRPDGAFPYRSPDPTAPGALDALAARVVAEKADAGLAYDGDADRLAMVDERGQTAFADRLLALLARHELIRRGGGRVVYELSCTQAVPDTVTAYGGEAVPCRVGYAFVHQAVRATGAILGGEAAGHLFFADPAFSFDDAMLATVRLVSLLAAAGRPLSALLAELPHYVSGPDRRFACPDELKGRVVETVRAALAAGAHPIENMDGVRVTFADGWALFRSSNTQPAVTLRCEARTADGLAEIEHTMLQAAEKALHAAGVALIGAHR